MKITADELLAAGVAPSIVAVFRALEPDGEMEITVETVARYLPAGIDLFEVARKVLPTEAWAVFENGNAALDEARRMTIKEAEETAKAKTIETRLTIPNAVKALLEEATANVTARLSDPMTFIAWNQGTVLTIVDPVSTAISGIQRAVSDSDTEVSSVEIQLRDSINKANSDFADSRVRLLVDVINSLPEETNG